MGVDVTGRIFGAVYEDPEAMTYDPRKSMAYLKVKRNEEKS